LAADYPHWTHIPTRWHDNDIYGHVNNTVHYQAMDTVINEWLIARTDLDIHTGAVIALCVASRCDYHAPISFPDAFRAGLRAAKVGRSSVTWQVGLFRDSDGEPLADGEFTHVFVNRDTRRSTPLPEPMRASISALLVDGIT
jgi:acyl-CoA thioester hydrolase